MRLLHSAGAVRASFDDPNVISCAGLEPVMRLAQNCDLPGIVAERVRVPGSVGANPAGKIATIVAGMVAGSDSIDDLNVVRQCGLGHLFGGVYAPSTLGSFLREFTHGQVSQLHAAHRELTVQLSKRTPVLAGAHNLVFIDIDSMLRRVYGKKKQGASFGHAKVGGYDVRLRGYNPLVATLSTLDAAPVVAETRLRGGKAGSARGAASMAVAAIGDAKACGAGELIVMRADSAFYSKKVIWACRRHGSKFSVTVKMDAKIRAAVETIGGDAWRDIRYPQAVWDEDEQRWISDAQIAEVSYTAFAGTKYEITARLVVRRVKRLNPRQASGQGELFTTWRHHAFFTDTPFTLVQAEEQHRDHAIVEQVNADLIDGTLAHLPSGQFPANAAWLVCAAMAFNLTRAAGHLASPQHAKARGATIRTQLVNVAARVARGARTIWLHLPDYWPWPPAWDRLYAAVHAAPA